MASTAERKAVAALVMVELVSDIFRQQASATLARQLDTLDAAMAIAWPHWQVLSQREVDRIYKAIRQFDQQNFAGQPHNPPVFTSLLIALVEDLAAKLKGVRADAVQRIHQRLTQVHRYYDRQLKKWDDYRTAARYLQAWEVI